MARWLDAAPAASLADESVVLDGTPIAVFRLGAEFFALHDLCPHGAARASITEATRSYGTPVMDGMVQVALD